jgi:hypothetical protein
MVKKAKGKRVAKEIIEAPRKKSRRDGEATKVSRDKRKAKKGEPTQVAFKGTATVTGRKADGAPIVKKGWQATPKPPTNPFAALMQPLVIIPNDEQSKPVVADAGTIVELMDQSGLYRNHLSPITRTADEILVRYGTPKKIELGWLTNQLQDKAMKPTKGPFFLVKTKDESGLSAWDGLRLAMGRSGAWLVPWIVDHADQYKPQIREVVKAFGGKPIKNEPTEVRSQKLFSLILHAEMDVATAKAIAKSAKSSKKSKKGKSAPEEKPSKKSKKVKVAKAEKGEKPTVANFTGRSASHDDFVIRRLVKENPRRAGSDKAKIWDRIRKGMTIAEFCKKGGTRGAVGRYIQNGWIKLLPARGATASE